MLWFFRSGYRCVSSGIAVVVAAVFQTRQRLFVDSELADDSMADRWSDLLSAMYRYCRTRTSGMKPTFVRFTRGAGANSPGPNQDTSNHLCSLSPSSPCCGNNPGGIYWGQKPNSSEWTKAPGDFESAAPVRRMAAATTWFSLEGRWYLSFGEPRPCLSRALKDFQPKARAYLSSYRAPRYTQS